MSIEEGITAMEMLGHDFFIFRDEETNKVTITYLRNDGKYGVIETE